jgi:hypothetical protein
MAVGIGDGVSDVDGLLCSARLSESCVADLCDEHLSVLVFCVCGTGGWQLRIRQPADDAGH